MSSIYKIAEDGTGDFRTIQDALKRNDDSVTLLLKPGVYYGQIFSTKKEIHLIGEDAENTIITGGIGAKQPHADGDKTGTFRTYTAYFAGDKVSLENLTIANTAGQGTVAGQAVALYASASYMYCKNVILKGYQDTLFTAPLPEKERIPRGFKGPEENLPRRASVQYYDNCFISGTIDFIFGSADVLFENCIIAIHDTTTECYVTAPSTPADGIGYIFNHCKIIKAEEFLVQKNKKIFLGRPWREYAKCCWMNSDFSDIICQEAWDNWGNVKNEKTATFTVYKNRWNYPAAAGKGNFATELTENKAAQMIKQAEKIRYLVTSSCSRDARIKAPIPLSSSETTGVSI